MITPADDINVTTGITAAESDRERAERRYRATASTAGAPEDSSRWQPLPKAVDVMGIPVVPFESYTHAVKYVEQAIASRKKSFWIAVNPQKIHRAMHEPRLRSLLTGPVVGLCDGVGVSLASKILHKRSIPRCTGCDLFFRLVAEAEPKGWKLFMLGASPESNEMACMRLKQRHPDLQIVGRRDGYFSDSAAVVEQINASGADLLFVAMGTPKQEYWIADHREAIDAPFCMGVGGSLDVASGTLRRAPKIFRKTGTEFLFQLVTQPKRFKRQIAYVPYTLNVLRERLFRRSR